MKKISILAAVVLFMLAVQANAANSTSTAKSQNDKAKNTATSTVSAAAKEIRGWSESEKKEFLSTVKEHAVLKSGQELENFAKGVLLKDENVTAVNADDDNVEVHYKLPAKFLGIFKADIETIANVTFETDKWGRGPKEVTVKFPWYRRFYSIGDDAREELLKSAIDKVVQEEAQTPRDNSYAQNGVTINLVSNILKAVRVQLNSTTTASTTVLKK